MISYFLLGCICLRTGKYAEAEVNFQQAIKSGKSAGMRVGHCLWDFYRSYEMLGWSYAFQGRYDEATKACEQTLAFGYNTNLKEVLESRLIDLHFIVAQERLQTHIESIFRLQELIAHAHTRFKD